MKNSDEIRTIILNAVSEFLTERGEEVLTVKSGTIAIPWARQGEEGFCTITVSIPRGTREGEPYDAYEEAKNYQVETKMKTENKEAAAKKKNEKIARDQKLRAEKAKIKAEKDAAAVVD